VGCLTSITSITSIKVHGGQSRYLIQFRALLSEDDGSAQVPVLMPWEKSTKQRLRQATVGGWRVWKCPEPVCTHPPSQPSTGGPTGLSATTTSVGQIIDVLYVTIFLCD